MSTNTSNQRKRRIRSRILSAQTHVLQIRHHVAGALALLRDIERDGNVSKAIAAAEGINRGWKSLLDELNRLEERTR